MVKVIALIIAIILANATNKTLGELPKDLNLLRFVSLTGAYILAQVVVFFLTAFILTLPLKDKESEEYSQFYRFVMRCYTKVCLSLFSVKINAEGIEKLPKDENFVIVSNHLSNLDSLVMDVYLKDYPLVFVAKDSLFKIPFFGKMIRKIGYLSLDRSDVRQELITMKKGISILDKGIASIGVYPEGTRNFTDETLLEFKPGCFHLVTKSKKPLVVCITRGTNEVKNNLFFKKHEVTFRIIRVIQYEEIKDLNTYQISELVRNIMLENIEYDLKNDLDVNKMNIEEV